MFTKIDVTGIVQAHADTLTDERTRARAPEDIVLFVGVPAITASALVVFGARLTPDGVNVLITALSVFAGLLFNLLVLAHALRAGGTARTERERRFLRAINVNLEYAILVSLVTIAVCLLTVFAPAQTVRVIAGDAAAVRQVVGWVSGLIAFCTIHFLLTLLMVLKRMHVTLGLDEGPRPAPLLRDPLLAGPGLTRTSSPISSDTASASHLTPRAVS